MNPQPIKGKLPILISLLIIVLALMWLAGRCSRSNENTIARQIRHYGGDTISVAIEMSPTSYVFSGDTATGFDYEMLQAISKEHNIPMAFHPFAPINYALDGLRSGDFDIVVANVPASEDLKKDFCLTNDVFVDRQVLVRRKSEINDSTKEHPLQMSLLGDTVWIADSSPFRNRLSNLSHELGDTIYIKSSPEYTSEHLVLLTALGEIKQAVVNESIAKKLAADYPDLDITTPISMTQFQPWIVNCDKVPLRDSLNNWIEQYKTTPAYNRLVEKYIK